MEVILEDGEVVQLGGLARESVGYDLRGAFVGSEGTFGIATKILVRLLPVPESVRTFLGIFSDIDSACTAVSAIIGHGIIPAALEMIDALSIKAVQNVTDAGYPNDAGAVLLIELEGLHEEVDELSAEVESALWDTGAADVPYRPGRRRTRTVVGGPQNRVWRLRHDRSQLLPGGRRRPAHPPDPDVAEGHRGERPLRHHHRQRLPRRRRQPAPLHAL